MPGGRTFGAAGGTVAGGHTIRNPEPIYGLAVQGVVHPDRVFRKSGAQPGDVLMLSKPIGTGLALAGGSKSDKQAAIDGMKKAPSVAATPLDGVIEVGQIVEYAQSVSPNSMLDLVLQSIKEYAGKDKVLVNGNVIPRGVVYRLSIDEGVLRAIGAAAKAGGQNNGGF